MRAILDSVATRLFSLGVALAIAGAPIALEACQIACGSMPAQPAAVQHAHVHGDHHAAAASHASHHDAPAPPHRLLPQSAACDHDGDATAPSIVAARNSDGGLLAASPVVPGDEVVPAGATALVRIPRSTLPDCLGIRLASPLRV
jgi:hypothetical protein